MLFFKKCTCFTLDEWLSYDLTIGWGSTKYRFVIICGNCLLYNLKDLFSLCGSETGILFFPLFSSLSLSFFFFCCFKMFYFYLVFSKNRSERQMEGHYIPRMLELCFLNSNEKQSEALEVDGMVWIKAHILLSQWFTIHILFLRKKKLGTAYFSV